MNKILFLVFSVLLSVHLMAGDINWSFPPDNLSTSGASVSNPLIAMDSNGNIVSVWFENGVLKARSKPEGMGWSATSTLSGANASFASIVSDLNGNATAIWLENGLVKASSKSLNGSWSVSVTISGSAASMPSLAVDSSGNVIAAWARNSDIQTSTKLFGASWQNAVTINSSGAAYPNIAMNGSGTNSRAVVVWHSTSANAVYASSRLLSGSWSSAQMISNSLHRAGYARVAADSAGNATAIWFRYDVAGSAYQNVIVQAASKPVNGTWGEVISLSDPGVRDPATLRTNVAYDGLGNVIALWDTSFNDETYFIQSSVQHISGGWSKPINLVADNLYSYKMDLSLASLGNAVALYMFYNGIALQIQSSEIDITGFVDGLWSVPVGISSETNNAFPSVASSVTGNVIHAAAVWISSNGMNESVLASIGSKPIVSPPTNLSISNSTVGFGVFTEYVNTLSWEASADPKVVGYLVYRNGLFVSQVDASVLSFIDDNRGQNAAVTYGVAAIDDGQSHSRIISISSP